MADAQRVLLAWSPWWDVCVDKMKVSVVDTPGVSMIGHPDMTFEAGEGFLSGSSPMVVAEAMEFALQQALRDMDSRTSPMKRSNPLVSDSVIGLAQSLEINSDIKRKFSNIDPISWKRMVTKTISEEHLPRFDALDPPRVLEGSWLPEDFGLPEGLRAEQYVDMLSSIDKEMERDWMEQNDPGDPEEQNEPDSEPGETTPSPDPEPGEADPSPDPEPGTEPGETDPSPDPEPGDTGPAAGAAPGENSTEPDPEPGEPDAAPDPEPGEPDIAPGTEPGETDPSPDPEPGDTGPAAGAAPGENSTATGAAPGGPDASTGAEPGETGTATGGDVSDGVGALEPSSGSVPEGRDSGPAGGTERSSGDPAVDVGSDGSSPSEGVTDDSSGFDPVMDILDAEPEKSNTEKIMDLLGGSPVGGDDDEDEDDPPRKKVESDSPRRLEDMLNQSDETAAQSQLIPGESHEGDGEEEGDEQGLSAAEQAQMKDDLAESIQKHADSTSGQGFGTSSNAEGYFEQWAEVRRKKSRRRWKRQFQRIMAPVMGRAILSGDTDMSYSKRNPNQQENMPIMMGFITYPPEVSIIIDCSPSMLRDAQKTYSEFADIVQHIFMRYSQPVTVIMVDNTIQNVIQTTTPKGRIKKAVARTYNGGSADFGYTMKKIIRKGAKYHGTHPKPDVTVVITDCEFDWPWDDRKRVPNNCGDVIIVSTQPYDRVKGYLPPWVRPGKNFVEAD